MDFAVNLKIEILLTVFHGPVKWLAGIIGAEVRMPYTLSARACASAKGMEKGRGRTRQRMRALNMHAG